VITELEHRLTLSESNITTSVSRITTSESRLNTSESKIAKSESDIVALYVQVRAITPPKPVAGPMPTSCNNYKTMGHTQSGFFMVKAGTKVKTVYCDFSKTIGIFGKSSF